MNTPETTGHAEFVRDCLAENRQLKAINAELLEALKDLIGYAAAEIGIPPNEAVGGAFKKARAAIAKAEGK